MVTVHFTLFILFFYRKPTVVLKMPISFGLYFSANDITVSYVKIVISVIQ